MSKYVVVKITECGHDYMRPHGRWSADISESKRLSKGRACSVAARLHSKGIYCEAVPADFA